MKDLYFDNYEDLALSIAYRYDSLTDEYSDVSVIAKYNEAKEIIKELLCLGYDIASIDIQREEFDEYWDEYIISLNYDGVWCEKYKRENGYLEEDSDVTYISNECNSAVIPYIKSKSIYAFSIGNDDNTKDVCVCDIDFTCDNCELKESNDKKTSVSQDNDNYKITVKCKLNAVEAMKLIDDVERRMLRPN